MKVFSRVAIKPINNKSCILISAFLTMLVPGLIAQELPAKDAVLKQMALANKYFMDKWPDPGANIVTDKVRPSNLWTRATYYEGLLAYYDVIRDTLLYQYAVDWGESHSWEPAYGGITRDANNLCCGQSYIELYLLDERQERIGPIKTCIDSMVHSIKNDDWWWVDAIQMAMPVFAKLGALHNDTAYYRKMYDLYNNSRTEQGDSGLYNQSDHLWWRDSDFDPPYKTPEGKNCYWSRGNGWVFAALARVLDVLPENTIHREEYLNDFKDMAKKLIEIQRDDGFWNPSLVDPDDYGGKETSGTAFFTFGIAWGINHQILDTETYKPYVIKAWNGMVNDALHPDGFLGYVQGTGKQPSDGQPLTYNKPPNFEDYGLGAFLLAGSEVYYLAPDSATGGVSSVQLPELVEYPSFLIYPNPAKERISIHYSLSVKSGVTIALTDIRGVVDKILFEDPNQDIGDYSISFDVSGSGEQLILPGIYIIRLITDGTVQSGKLIITN
jgi:unsaturated rhamnogalacturonyl hydrolase